MPDGRCKPPSLSLQYQFSLLKDPFASTRRTIKTIYLFHCHGSGFIILQLFLAFYLLFLVPLQTLPLRLPLSFQIQLIRR